MNALPDAREVREFVETYIAQARAATKQIERPGVLQMILVHPNDDDVTSIYRYALDDDRLAQRMTDDAIKASKSGLNCYIEARTVRRGLKSRQRGGYDDTVAVFSLVVDSDADKGAAWTPSVPVSLAVETSPGNAHFWFFFEQAIEPASGRTLGEQLRAITKADANTGNICQPYRLAGTVNYPNKNKRERGRIVVPTRGLEFNPETLYTPERFSREFPPAQPKLNCGGQANSASSVPEDIMRIVREGVAKDADRSKAFFKVVGTLKRSSYSLAEIVSLLDRFPGGIAEKYRGRVQGEVERIWNKLEPAIHGESLAHGGQQEKRRFELKPFDAIKVSRTPNYLVKGILPRSGLVVVWGPPKCGKSFWTFDLIMHVVINRDYRGQRVHGGAVVYLALEGGCGFAARVEAWRRRHLTDHQGPVPFYLLDVAVDLIADRDALIEAIREQVAAVPLVSVVIDTLNRAIVGDENKSDDMAKFIRAADAIRTAFDCLVIIIHHCGVVGNRPRGHTSLSGADDAQIAVERDKEGVVVAKVEHMKDAEAGTVIACKLEKVELGTDADGEPLSSCVIVPAEGSAGGLKLSKVQRFAFELLQKLIEKEGVVPPDDAQLPAGSKACLVDTWRKRFYETYPAEKQDTKKKALFRAILDLEQEHLIVLWRDYVWVRDKRDKSEN
jgi:hypothetical protein